MLEYFLHFKNQILAHAFFYSDKAEPRTKLLMKYKSFLLKAVNSSILKNS